MLWSGDADGQTTWANERWARYSGIEMAEGRRPDWLESIHPDEREAALARWNRSIETGEIYQSELRMLRNDGVYRWQMARALPVYNDEGAVTSWFGSITDIEEIRSGQARYRMLGDALPQMIWIASANGDITYNNKRWYEFTGMGEDEGPNTGWEAVIHPDDVEPTRERWRQSLETGESYEVECRMRRTMAHTAGR